MPHCILEYSSNIDPLPDLRSVLGDIHSLLLATGEFRIEDMKSRALRREVFLVGDDPDAAFVTLEIAILSGRTDELKGRISEGLLALLQSAFRSAGGVCNFSVRITDLHRPSYRRASVNTRPAK